MRTPARPVLALLALAACGPRLASHPASEASFDAARSRGEVEWLADPAREGRGTGTAGGREAAAWIADRLAEAGLRPAFEGGYLQRFEAPIRVRAGAEVRHERAETANVAAILPGRDPAHAGECVVVGAHHDHLGFGGDGSLAPDSLGTIHPGADDDASGVAAVLAAARAAAAQGPARRTLVFAAFGAEELGLLGSAELVRRPPPGCAVAAMALMVNLDTIGRPQGGKVYLEGADSARGLRELVTGVAGTPPALGLDVVFGAGGEEASDARSFRAGGVPVVFLHTGAHADYHRPSDTPDKLDYAGLTAVARLAWRIAREAAERDERLEPVRSPAPSGAPPGERDRGYGAYLGAIPDFAERKEPGVLLSGVRPGSPAEQAGLAGGDVLLRVGTTKILSLKDLAVALRA
ncbi:MAG TPA: M20/M25/M40 family metallo-hydrolase, partial [Anaeromyxobacter sp.]